MFLKNSVTFVIYIYCYVYTVKRSLGSSWLMAGCNFPILYHALKTQK